MPATVPDVPVVPASKAGEAASPAASVATASPASALPEAAVDATTDSGRDIYLRFRAGLADPTCAPGTGARWQQHFAHVPSQLSGGGRNGELLPLFAYVVDALREAHLPTEYALIPFVESGYRPAARSASGPAGLWQFIAVTARNHRIAIRPGYDGRLSPVDSTQAAVRYLKTLHGMFAGDWRLAVMAYNAGEYRVLGALKRHGQRAADADPAALDSLAPVTQAYVRKLHALTCVLAEADDGEAWMRALDRPVPRLRVVDIATSSTLAGWAAAQGVDMSLVKRLNPALAEGRIPQGARALAPMSPLSSGSGPSDASAARDASVTSMDAIAEGARKAQQTPSAPTAGESDRLHAPATPRDGRAVAAPGPDAARTHIVVRGDSASRIAKRYGIALQDLLARNGLEMRSVLRPGTVLQIDVTGDAAAAVAN